MALRDVFGFVSDAAMAVVQSTRRAYNDVTGRRRALELKMRLFYEQNRCLEIDGLIIPEEIYGPSRGQGVVSHYCRTVHGNKTMFHWYADPISASKDAQQMKAKGITVIGPHRLPHEDGEYFR